jgi:hypothetical protein
MHQGMFAFSPLTRHRLLMQDARAPVASFSEKAHLLSSYSAVCWPSTDESSNVLAVGSQSGSISLWDTKRGEIKHKLSSSAQNDATAANRSSKKDNDGEKKGVAGGHASRVTGLAFSAQNKRLFSCAEGSGTVLQWNTENGSVVNSIAADKRSVHRVAATADGSTLFAAGTASGADVAVIDVASGKRRKQLQGHSLPVTGMTLSADEQVLVTCSDERNIHLWDLADSADAAAAQAGAGGAVAPTVVLLHPSRPLPDTLSIVRVKKGVYHVASVSEDGKAHVWRYKRSKDSSDGKANKPITAGCVIALAQSSNDSAALKSRTGLHAEKSVILAIRLVSDTSSGSTTAVVAAGTLASPSFYRASYTDADDASHLRATVELAAVNAAAKQQKDSDKMDDDEEDSEASSDSDAEDKAAAKAASGSGSKTQAGSEATAAIVEARGKAAIRASATANDTAEASAAAIASQSRKRKRSESADDAAAAASGAEAEADGDLTLGERMRAVIDALRNPAATDLTSALADGSDAPTAGGAASSASSSSIAAQIISTGSLAVVLQQALQSRDDAQLELVLAHSDKGIIHNTVAKLPPTCVLPFLSRVVSRFQAKPSRGLQLVVWLRALLSAHTGYLLTVPHLIASLEALYTIIDSRLGVYKKLVKLSGRLDLLMAQVANGSSGAAVGSSGSAAAPSGRTLKKARLSVSQAALEAQNAMTRKTNASDDVDDNDSEEDEDEEDADEDAEDDDDEGEDDEDDEDEDEDEEGEEDDE